MKNMTKINAIYNYIKFGPLQLRLFSILVKSDPTILQHTKALRIFEFTSRIF